MTTTVTYQWECLECDAHGEGPPSNTEATKHVAATGHVTNTTGRPA